MKCWTNTRSKTGKYIHRPTHTEIEWYIGLQIKKPQCSLSHKIYNNDELITQNALVI